MNEKDSIDTRSVTLLVGAMATAVTFLGTGNVFTLWDTIVGGTLLCLLFAASPFETLPFPLRVGAASLLSICVIDIIGVVVDRLLRLTVLNSQNARAREPFSWRDGIFFGLWFVLALCFFCFAAYLDRLGRAVEQLVKRKPQERVSQDD